MQGSCLCGAVAWEVGQEFSHMHHCHCSRCRKSHGTPYGTYLGLPIANLRLLRGEELVRRFESPGSVRLFCSRCGSVVPGGAVGDSEVYVPAASLDGDPGLRPAAHIFVGSKAPWWKIRDALPQFDVLPPGIPVDPIPTRPPLDPVTGAIRGSCLCGGVTFTVEGPPKHVYMCHCLRCRKARAALHACNAFFPASAFRFTRGEELVESYRVPEAERFAQHFCRTCGGKVARPNPERDSVAIPMGAFDEHPGREPEQHIFVGSKASWEEIPGDLPQHAEYPT